MTPHRGDTFLFHSSQQPDPRTLEELFELTRRPSRALDSPRALLPELQRYMDAVRYATLGAADSVMTADTNLELLHRSMIVKSQQNVVELVTRPEWQQFNEWRSQQGILPQPVQHEAFPGPRQRIERPRGSDSGVQRIALRGGAEQGAGAWQF